MNFNTDQYLWENKLRSIRDQDINLRVSLAIVDGHILEGNEVVGRFSSNQQAEDTLLLAGFRKDQGAFAPTTLLTANDQNHLTSGEWALVQRLFDQGLSNIEAAEVISRAIGMPYDRAYVLCSRAFLDHQNSDDQYPNGDPKK